MLITINQLLNWSRLKQIPSTPDYTVKFYLPARLLREMYYEVETQCKMF